MYYIILFLCYIIQALSLSHSLYLCVYVCGVCVSVLQIENLSLRQGKTI